MRKPKPCLPVSKNVGEPETRPAMRWYQARLRWAVMADEGEGLRHWEESDCFFRSADWAAAFARALAIGRA